MNIKFTKEGVKFGDEFFTLNDIAVGVNKAKIREEDLVILKMEWPHTRSWDGNVEQIVLPSANIERIREILTGKNIYFGEINGKHSEVFGTLEESEFEVDHDVDRINDFLCAHPTGHSYEHSFIHAFEIQADEEEYEDVNKDTIKEFESLVYNN